MSLVKTMRWGIVSHYNEEKGWGFVRDAADGTKTFFHMKAYRVVNPATDEVQNEPWLSKRGKSERLPLASSVIVFWLDFSAEVVEGKSPPAGEWSFADDWNRAMVAKIGTDQKSSDQSITEKELLKGLEDLMAEAKA